MEKIKKFLFAGRIGAALPEDVYRAFQDHYVRQNLVSAGLAIKTAGASPQFQSAAIAYLLGGQLLKKVAVAATTLSTAVAWTGVASTFNAGGVLLTIDNAGNITQVPTSIVSTLTSQAAAIAGITWPVVPDNVVVIGAIVVSTSAANTTFTGGTTNLDAANITVDYLNIVGPMYPVTQI